MNSVKLAPFIGLTANTHVELESLSSLIGTYPSPDSQFQNQATYTSQIKSIPERPTIAIPETVDNVASERATAYKRSRTLKGRRNRRDQVSPLSITDVNNLWGVYLKQQDDLGGKHFLSRCHKLCVLKCRRFFFFSKNSRYIRQTSYGQKIP